MYMPSTKQQTGRQTVILQENGRSLWTYEEMSVCAAQSRRRNRVRMSVDKTHKVEISTFAIRTGLRKQCSHFRHNICDTP